MNLLQRVTVSASLTYQFVRSSLVFRLSNLNPLTLPLPLKRAFTNSLVNCDRRKAFAVERNPRVTVIILDLEPGPACPSAAVLCAEQRAF